jgi:transcriptional regulator with XRE-family HTH domain
MAASGAGFAFNYLVGAGLWVLAGPLAIASTPWLTEAVSPVNVGSIGEYIRQQREQAKISLRQLASAAGVSNPYLSQIERGLRRPSAEILQQIAKGLRISAEALYVQAGILEDRRPDSGVRAAVLADPELAERQKQVLLEIYESFRRETALNAQADTSAEATDPGPGPGTTGTVPESVGPEGASADGAGGESTDLGSIAPASTGTGSTGTGSSGTGSTGTGSTGTGSTGDGSDGTDQESSGAEAPAHHPSRPARSGQGE